MSDPHQVPDPQTMARLGSLIEQAAAGKPIRGSAIDELASRHGVPASHLYTAAANATMVPFAREHRVAFVVCVGGCLTQGGSECLEHLVTVRRGRLKKWFKKPFDIQTRACLNRCEFAPAIRLETPGGVAFVERATRGDLDDAVKALCG